MSGKYPCLPLCALSEIASLDEETVPLKSASNAVEMKQTDESNNLRGLCPARMDREGVGKI